jgi:hypothetical protein
MVVWMQVVLLPVGLGAFLNQTFPTRMKKAAPFAPLLAVSMTVRPHNLCNLPLSIRCTLKLWACHFVSVEASQNGERLAPGRNQTECTGSCDDGALTCVTAELHLQVLICASVLAQNAAAVKQASAKLLGAVFALHASGFALGYALARVFGVGERQARTMSIEVGM